MKKKVSNEQKRSFDITDDAGWVDLQAHPHVAPVYAGSTFLYESPDHAAAVFKGEADAFIYARWSHPNAELIERKMEWLESADGSIRCKALAFTSGMAALSALVQSYLRTGDTILAQGNIYGTSVDYFNYYASQFGMQVIYHDFADLNGLVDILKANKSIRLLYAETPSNPTLQCYDLKKLSQLAHKHNARLAVDNTFATPVLQQPFRFGADFIVHSATKYLNGHGNALGGFLLGTDIEFMQNNVWKVRKLNGTICPPFDSWLLNNGLKTLHLRMQQHCANATALAAFLAKHQAVEAVYYPGRTDAPTHSLAKKQMSAYGGVVSFLVKGGPKTALKVLRNVKKCKLTASLGVADTLIQHPASMSHYFMPPAQRKRFGIHDNLLRVSVGINDIRTVMDDLAQALA